MPEVVAAVERAHREEWGRVLATVARLLDGDLATAEECTQEAFEQALRTWGERGIPRSPGAWLTTTARRRALDRVRRESALRARLPDLVVDEVDDPETEEAAVAVDDRLRLVFTCCHPALAPESRTEMGEAMRSGIADTLAAPAGMAPEVVAQQVVDAILTDRFWVIPTTDMVDGYRARFAEILDNCPPEG